MAIEYGCKIKKKESMKKHRFLFLRLTISVNYNKLQIATKYLQKSTFLNHISKHLNYADHKKSATHLTKGDTHIK